ncbi:putative clathrin assembly protein At4g40080 [Pyrus x bretschneideri]|uniref:putative clathrin assembly protein At4g40080 n=1 Tax=Pyrus x bretschneideri TaxID=225117 RepID=UPI00051082D7|nr:putative clathrin assembly protein At4g40080 [Pyrus x bretschneideri]
MARFKFIGILKDRASILKATLTINRRVSSVHLAVLRATTHDPSRPPSETRIASVLALGLSSRLTACACIDALMDRLHVTRSAFVALKCLLTIHNIISKGSFILKDQLAYYPCFGGYNFLNLSMFCDNSDFCMLEYSSWVRWFAGVVEQNLMVSRAIGYYLNSSKNEGNKRDKEEKALALLDSDLAMEIEVLVEFVVRICDAPDSLELQKNNLVYEVVRATGEDYRSVQREIVVRVKEVGDRIDSVDGLRSAELTRLIDAFERLEGCKGKLMLLFVNRKRNDGLWDLVRETKARLVEMKEQREERLVVFPGKDELAESTQCWNPFLEPGQLLLLPSGGGWLGFGPTPIAV